MADEIRVEVTDENGVVQARSMARVASGDRWMVRWRCDPALRVLVGETVWLDAQAVEIASGEETET